jgi:lysozyme family protein
MQLTPENTHKGYEALWAKMVIRPEKKEGFARYANLIAAGRSEYEEVEKTTGVPWWFVGIIHLRESNCNFKTALHNGDPLWDRNGNPLKTVHVPAGRGPFKTWAEGASDALRLEGLDKVKAWDLPTALFEFEKYNGLGYISKGVNSPYVWAGSNLYSRGKFVADGKFSSIFIDPQPGCAPMLQILIATGFIPALAKEVINMVTDAISPAAPAPVVPVSPASNTSTGVTVNPAQNLATHIITAIGVLFAATGLAQIHSTYDAITSSSLIGGLLVSGLAMLISHFNVNGSNTNTIDMIDKVLVALTPTHPAVSAGNFSTQAASTQAA